MTDSFVPCRSLRNPLQWLLSEKVNRPLSEVHCCIPINDLLPPTVQEARNLSDRHPGYSTAGLHHLSSIPQHVWTLHSGAWTSSKTGSYRAGSAQCFAWVHHPDQGSGVMSWAASLNSLWGQMDQLRLEQAWASVEHTTEWGVPCPWGAQGKTGNKRTLIFNIKPSAFSVLHLPTPIPNTWV